jgi:hypothetical protein
MMDGVEVEVLQEWGVLGMEPRMVEIRMELITRDSSRRCPSPVKTCI